MEHSGLRELLDNVLPNNNTFNDYEVEHEFEDIGRETMILNARRVDHLQLILLAVEEQTAARRAAAALLSNALPKISAPAHFRKFLNQMI